MDLVNINDEQGNTITFKRYQGRAYQKDIVGNVRDQLDAVANLKCRPDDVLLCTFPKSGTHWIFNMVKMIRSGTLQYTGTPLMLEYEDLRKLGQMESPRTYHTHLNYPLIPREAREGHLKVIHVVRNPKDVARSFYDHVVNVQKNATYVGSFNGYLRYFLSDEFIASGGSWFTHTREWHQVKASHPKLKLLTLRFEDVKQNVFENIVKIGEFLGVKHDEAFLRDVERSVAFENLKKEHAKSAGETDVWKHQGNGGRMPIYNKGNIGDWKNVFTVTQNERFDAYYKETMTDKGAHMDFVYE